MHIVVVVGGEVMESSLVLDRLTGAKLRIAADSGAETLLKFGFIPDVVVGDFDSIKKETLQLLRKKGVKILPYPAEKDYTDTELAIEQAIQMGATKITIIGGLRGDRFDHIIANLFLALFVAISIEFIDGHQISLIIRGPSSVILHGKKNDLLSLVPLMSDAVGITLANLRYPLHSGTLTLGRARGVSNIFLGKKATVHLESGVLLLVHTCQ